MRFCQSFMTELHRHLGDPTRALAGQNTGLPVVGDAPVLAEQEADLPAPDPDVAGRDVGVGRLRGA